MTELWQLTATELASRIRRRDVSARETAEAALARLDAVNPSINAVVDHRPDQVRDDADAVDRAIACGDDPGPLAGVPVTVKVNIDQAGFATTNGVTLQRDLIAQTSSPVVDNLKRAGAVILGRTNTPAFSLRWFTTNLIHGNTRNPRDPSLTPGGSSGGAAAAAAAGIGCLAHGTDIAGSIRYPAYACGVHGLRPSLGRVAAYNASSPERSIGAQLMAVSGPIGRSIADLRVALAAMATPDSRDPWWVPALLEGPPVPRVATLCLQPDGLPIVAEVEAALLDAARRLEAAGWIVETIGDVPSLREACELQVQLWLGDGFAGLAEAARREGDPGALAVVAAFREQAESWPPDIVARALVRRATLTREWLGFLNAHPVLLLPVSAELPFQDGLDMRDEASFRRVWRAQATQIGLPLMGLPGLAVSTGLVGATPVGVQLVSRPYREDLCLLAGEAIEAGGVPAAPIDPV
ncbi:amidase family protein [Acidiphilium iwatense]|uniref:Amidase family protein n=1 Tax=Acidiphilium iwatense TaxID=768198 RepID=A0ABS9DU62_9PROT|nr:amidase family protein [Acidiphilium iwatense]MCF3946268.1 amidase family protein [Acidiphilium iwatense]